MGTSSHPPFFERYIGIDYSGASMPTKALPGLRVYQSNRSEEAYEVKPPTGKSKHWTRSGIAAWLGEQLSQEQPTLVGIDHGLSFPIQYFDQHRLALDWEAFLEDFQHHWPTDQDLVSVESVRQGYAGSGQARQGDSRWRRLTELRSRGAKSVFHFDVQGSVAKSTHAGLPWLLKLRQTLRQRIHFWPFDGWVLPLGSTVIVEAYPALSSRSYPREGRDEHQHDAYSIVRWMQEMDASGGLGSFFHPTLSREELRVSSIEGWILGVM